jgi:hypothetical protein
VEGFHNAHVAAFRNSLLDRHPAAESADRPSVRPAVQIRRRVGEGPSWCAVDGASALVPFYSARARSMDDPWAADRTRVAVCVSVTPLHGVDFGTLEAAVLGVEWGERKLKWHDSRWAPCSESVGGRG